MKNGRNATALVFKIVSWVCVAAFAVGVLFYGLSAGFGLSELIEKPEEEIALDYTYKYEETPRSLREIRVDWLDGPVTLGFHHGDAIRITEKAGRALQEDEKLQMELSGGELSIHWNDDLMHTNVFLETTKSLDIRLPMAFYEKLELVRIYTASGDIALEDLEAVEVDAETVSGVLTLKDIRAESVRIGSTSGNIDCTSISGEEKIRVHTVSGAMQLSALSGGEVKVDSTSGEVVLDGSADVFECATVSGNVACTLHRWPETLKAESVSGNLQFTLPESEAGFIGKFDTVSGAFDSTFEVRKRGKQYEYGQGKAAVELSTTSGNAALYKAAE